MQFQVVTPTEHGPLSEQAASTAGVDGAWVPLAAAAQRLNTPLDTLRRRAKQGAVRARRVPTPQGHRWEVYLAAAQSPPAGQRSVDGTLSQRSVGTPASQDLAGLVALVDRVTAENLQLAGRVGWLESELKQARERLALMEGARAAGSAPRPWWRRWWPGR